MRFLANATLRPYTAADEPPSFEEWVRGGEHAGKVDPDVPRLRKLLESAYQLRGAPFLSQNDRDRGITECPPLVAVLESRVLLAAFRPGIYTIADWCDFDTLADNTFLLVPGYVAGLADTEDAYFMAEELWAGPSILSLAKRGCSGEELRMELAAAIVRRRRQLERDRRDSAALIPMQDAGVETGFRRAAIPDDVKMFVWQRDQGACNRCGSNRDLEFDHVIPVSRGGSNTARNLQLLCEPCNRSKGANLI